MRKFKKNNDKVPDQKDTDLQITNLNGIAKALKILEDDGYIVTTLAVGYMLQKKDSLMTFLDNSSLIDYVEFKYKVKIT
jgi:DNA-binding transcriptional regulator YhcF (GntR family)